MKIIRSFKDFDLDEVLTSPLVLWLISIVMAVTMWIYVTGLEESTYITRKFSAQLEYRGLDAQALMRGRTSEVDVEIRGPEQAMMRLDYNAVNAYVDARNLLPGKRYTVNINVDLPSEITLISCVPSQVTLDLVRQVTRLMNVETVLPSSLPEGQYIEGVEIIPKEVGIRGAEDDVAKVGSVRITPSIEDLQSGRDLLLPVRFAQSEPFEGSVNIEPAQVRFKGNLVRGLPRKRVSVNVRLTGRLDTDYQVQSIITDPSEIQIEGSAEDLAKVEAVDTELIDISMLNADSIIVAPLRPPEVPGVSIVNTSSVRVSLQLSETRAEKLLTNIPVELRGTNEAQKWICNPSMVTVTVEGKPSLIENFDADIKAYADMSNIFMAPVVLPVRAEILSGDEFHITKVEPATVTINQL